MGRALDITAAPPMLAGMAVSGTVPARTRRGFDPQRVARWVRRATVVALVVFAAFCFAVFGTETVPPGMRTVPGLEPGALCFVDRRASAVAVGRDVFVRIDGALLLSRVAALDGDTVTLHNPDAEAPWPDSRAFGPVPRRQVRGTVLFALAPAKPGASGG